MYYKFKTIQKINKNSLNTLLEFKTKTLQQITRATKT